MQNSKKTSEILKERAKKKKGEVTYEDIEDIVEYLVATKSYSYQFDCYGRDDIAQEIRIICLKKLPKFDPEKVKPEKWKNFFGRCVDNGLKNLKRDNYIRTSSPYKKKYEQLDETDTSKEAQKIRKLYKRFQERIKKKLGILHACPISPIQDIIKNDKFAYEMEYKELERHLIEKANNSIDDNIVEPLRKMLAGEKGVTKREKQKVQNFVNRILDNQDY